MQNPGWANFKNVKEFLENLGKGPKKDSEDHSMTIPNRRDLRTKGIGVTQRTGKPYARLTGRARMLPASLERYVAIRRLEEDGKTVTIVMPKAYFERENQ
jgi:hypothetical protein